MKKPDRQTIWSASIPGAVFLLSALPFAGALACGYIQYDDDHYTLLNPTIQSGLTFSVLAWAFTHAHESLYAPLTWISYGGDISLFGNNPSGHHLINILLHAAAAALLYLLAARILKSRPAAFVTALLFAIHPLRVESVVWIAGRKDVLCAVFFMLALLAYDATRRAPAVYKRIALLAAVSAAMLSKPTAIVLPAVLVLMDFWPYAEPGTPSSAPMKKLFRSILVKTDLFLAAALISAATAWTQRGAMADVAGMPLRLRMANAATAYVTYLYQTILPIRLALPYYLDANRVSLPLGILAAAAMLAALIACILVRKRYPALLFSWCWFVGTILPVGGLIQIGHHTHADRFTYLAHIGLFLGLAATLLTLLEHRRRAAIALFAATCCVLAAFGAQTFAYTRAWRDGETLFAHSVAMTENNYVAQLNLGNILLEKGRAAEALPHLEAAANINPKSVKAWNNYGAACLNTGQPVPALNAFNQAILLTPDDPDLWCNAGMALMQLGQYGPAAHNAQEALRRNPTHPNATMLLQQALQHQPKS